MTTQPASRIAAVLRELGKLELGPHREAVHNIVANIAELHAHCDELEAEVDRLRAERDKTEAALRALSYRIWLDCTDYLAEPGNHVRSEVLIRDEMRRLGLWRDGKEDTDG